MTDAELIARLRDAPADGLGTENLCLEAADRIKDLTAKLATCEKYRDAYDEMGRIGTQAVRDLEAKLAKALEALDEAVYLLDPDEKDMMRQAGVYRIVTTLAEIKGESHDPL